MLGSGFLFFDSGWLGFRVGFTGTLNLKPGGGGG